MNYRDSSDAHAEQWHGAFTSEEHKCPHSHVQEADYSWSYVTLGAYGGIPGTHITPHFHQYKMDLNGNLGVGLFFLCVAATELREK